MAKLYLFDVDGTLVGGVTDSTLVVSAAPNRFTEAIKNVVHITVERTKDYRGLTDYLILRDLLQEAGLDQQRINDAMPAILREVNQVHRATFDLPAIELLPGIRELLTALQARGAVLGLVTGNLKPIAERKLKGLGIWSLFSVGGFGNDPHEQRADLIHVAVDRAGFEQHMSDVYVIGDTPNDIEAAKQAGIQHRVGVANSYRDIRELKDAGAELAFEDFRDTARALELLDCV